MVKKWYLLAIPLLLILSLPFVVKVTNLQIGGPFSTTTQKSISVPVENPLSFTYDLAKVTISNQGAQLIDENSSAEIIFLDPIYIPKGTTITEISHEAEIREDTNIYYQLTTDYDYWYYFDGNKWTEVGTCEQCYNTIGELNSNIRSFPITTDSLRLKIFMESTGENIPVLRNINLNIETTTAVIAEQEETFASAYEVFACHDDDERLCECERGVKILTVLYNGPDDVTINVYARKNHQKLIQSFTHVQSGDSLTIDGSAYMSGVDKTNRYFEIEEEDIPDASVHTSCSEEIINKTYGNFTVTSYIDYYGNVCDGQDNDDNDDNNDDNDNDNDDDNNDDDDEGLVCPLTQAPDRTIVEISDTYIRSDLSLAHALAGPVTVSLPQGNYTVTLVSYDDHTGKVGQTQPNESYFVQFKNTGDQIIVESNAIADLEDDQDWKVQEVDANLFIDEAVSTIYAKHAAYPSSNPNSIYPICAAFDKLAENLPPIAEDDSAETTENTPVDIDVLENDSDPDGNLVPETVEVTESPQNGSVVVDEETGVNTYTPNTGFVGTDTYTYEVCDDDGACDTALVTVIVHEETVIIPDIIFDADDTPLCEYDEITITVTGQIILPPDETASLQLSYRIVNPDDLQTETEYFNYGEVHDGDTFSYDVVWPGIRPLEEVVEIHIGGMLLDVGTGNPLMDQGASLDYYWYPWVCPPPRDPVRPVLECVDEINEVEYIAHFGYKNENTVNVDIPIGGENKFTPAPQDRGQPTTFLPGRQTFVYEVPFNGDNLVWTLDGRTSTASRFSKRCNEPPVAEDDTKTVICETPTTIQVLNNDTDPEGALDPSSVEIITNPTHGTVNVNATSGVVTYTGECGYTSDTFKYQVCDDHDACDTAWVFITINPPPNIPPVAIDDQAVTPYETPVDINILNNDYDTDGILVPATTVVIVDPLHGEVTINPTNGVATYTPDNGFTGMDTFEYTVCDDDGACDEALVYVRTDQPPNVPPIAIDDAATTPFETPVTIDILANDSDPDGNIVPSLTDVVTDPENGSVSINPTNGEATYTPNANFAGIDTFEYVIFDNDGEDDTALVTITIDVGQCTDVILGFNDQPTGEILYNQYGGLGIQISAIANGGRPNAAIIFDTDASGTPDPDLEVGQGHAVIIPENVTDNDNDGLVDNPNDSSRGGKQVYTFYHERIVRSFMFIDQDSGNGGIARAYDSLNNIVGTANITNMGEGSIQTVNMNVGNVRRLEIVYPGSGAVTQFNLGCGSILLPPVAVDDSETTDYETPVDIDIVANDYDPDGSIDPTTVTVTDDPDNGSVSVNPSSGVATYTPDSGFYGTDIFDYSVCDNDGLCDTATVTIFVNEPPLEPPVALDDAETTEQDTPVDIEILDNDYDPDGTLVPSTITVTDDPDNGNVSINTTSGVATYTPNSGFIGTDTFLYEVCDNDSLCDSATVTVYIDPPPNEPPIAEDDTETTFINIPVDIIILDNDYDPDGVLVISTIEIISTPTHGIVTINPDGSNTYVPNTDYVGNDTYEYKVCDDDGACDTATVLIIINPIPNLPPVAVDDYATTQVDIPVEIEVMNNDYDTDGTLVPSSVVVIGNPSNGTTVVDSGTGVVTYTPDTGYTGTDTFEYEVCDNDGLCDEAVVTVLINPPDELTVLAHKIVCENEADLPNWGSGGPNITQNTAQNFIDEHPRCSFQEDWNFQWAYAPRSNPGDNTGEASQGDGWYTFGPTDVNGVAQITIPFTQEIDKLWMREVYQNGYILFTYNMNGKSNSDNVSAEFYCHTDVLNYDNYDWIQNLQADATYYCVGFNVAEEPPNLPPTAIDDYGTTFVNTPVSITIVDNDSDPDGNLVNASITFLTNPTNGTVTLNSVTGSITYTPDTNFIGEDQFDYEICDDDGLCDAATVFITVLPPENLPPVALDDSYTTDVNVPIDMDILANDSDPDGAIDPDTLTIVTFPDNGTVIIDPLTAIVTYIPDTGYVGTDSFIYTVCDNDGLCDDAVVDITITDVPIPPPPPPPPTPPPGEFVEIPDEFCQGTIYTGNDITFQGTVSTTNISRLEYSMNNGVSWLPITNVSGEGNIEFTINSLPGGNYVVLVRNVLQDGTVTFSSPCQFVVENDLIFGGNQFILDAQSSPLSDYGIVQFAENSSQTIYLEAVNATSAKIVNMDTGEEFNLRYDEDLKIWKGEIVFDEPGYYRLKGVISNNAGSYEREINTAYVTERFEVTDLTTNELLNDVYINIYEEDISTGSFKLWNGEAYGITNPLYVGEQAIEGINPIVLPEGTYYLEITRSGYYSATSLVTVVEEQSIVTAKVKLLPQGSFVQQLTSLFTRSDFENNFPLTLIPLARKEYLKIGDPVPEIKVTVENGNVTNLNQEFTDTPMVIMIYSNWNTLAQEQLEIFSNLAQKYGEQYQFVPLSTLEPDNQNITYIQRGRYNMDFYKPTDEFHDEFYTISLPQFLFVDEGKVLQGIKVGPQAEGELEQYLLEVL